ncbi:gamma-glutamyl-gamma-aminobutyrate hydrolase family protein [Paenarthrobacter sp. YJN-5]|uniref:gamma-glutamyl-gamma-aminobutyrate hydrolase family protein n=1 Tax=Paenarthrobacter sp. YJN-5 TaxID=2735316 RepID=UPI001D0C682C|nr:gamma-glutamyl-gamma-aminobutyrate hydrolase family protein [Paenarthrobacter sp. YJN-5]
MTTHPVIGLTTYMQQATSGVWNLPASFLPAHYFQAVTRAGGIAALLPPQPASAAIADQILAGFDGLVVTGGSDVNPASYGQAPHPTTDVPALERDAWEFALVRSALASGLPLLGICRGAQILNAALGGTIHQHLPDLLGHSRHQVGEAVFTTTSVHAIAGTRIAQIIGNSHEAQCYHHQAVDELGQGLIVSARDDEGVIEAIELDPKIFSDRWAVGVQWHPEQSPDDLRLFSNLVEASRAHRAKSSAHN